ncbi:MAG: tetratricopeptide repeat protein [Gemmatimonadaceae bacterium]
MTATRQIEGLLATARARRLTGAWDEVRSLLRDHGDAARAHPELAALRGESELRTGHPREARMWLTEILPALERSSDRAALRRAVNQLGVAEVELGALDAAERTFGRALELGRQDGDDLLIARATNNLGAIANIRGRRDEALALYQLAIPAYQRLGHLVGLAESYHNMAISCRDLGQLDRSEECERRAIAYAREARNASLVALARLGRAELSFRARDARLAEVGARRAAADFAALPDRIREADALRLVGAATLAQGKTDAASEALERAIELARAHGSALVEAEVLRVRAELRAAAGARAAARADAEAAAALYESLGAAAERQAVLAWMARTVPARQTPSAGPRGGGR